MAAHEHDFGQTDDFGEPLRDDACCRICGISLMSGYEFPLDWDEFLKSPGQDRNSQPE